MIDFEKINLSIAEEFKIPLLKYSENRKYAAIVVEKIRSKKPCIIKEFDKKINNFMKIIKTQIGKCDPSDFLLFITPVEICEAALFAIRQCRGKANS